MTRTSVARRPVTEEVTPTSLFDTAKKYYEPGGGFETGIQGQLSRAQQKFMSAGMQNLVSSGLANTTQATGLAGKFAEEVAAPTLANMESTRAQALSGLNVQQAGTLESANQSNLARQHDIDMFNLQRPTNYQPSGVSFSPGTPSAGFLTGYTRPQQTQSAQDIINQRAGQQNQSINLYDKINNLISRL